MKKEVKQIGYKLVNIKTEQFAVIDDVFKESLKVDISTSLKFQFSETQHLIIILSKFELLQKSKVFLILEISCSFSIEDDSWNFIWDDVSKAVTLPRNFAIFLAGINVHTSRGILHAKTEQTPYQRIHIPIIQIGNSINEDVVIKAGKSDIPKS